MELTIKEKLALALAKIQAGGMKLRHFKAYRIQTSEPDFDEFCKAAADIFDGCNLIEEIKDTCTVELGR